MFIVKPVFYSNRVINITFILAVSEYCIYNIIIIYIYIYIYIYIILSIVLGYLNPRKLLYINI